MLLSEAKSKYMRNLKLRGCTPKTIKGYEEILTRFISFIGNIETQALTYEIIEDYEEMLFGTGIKNVSIGSYLRHIKAFVHYLEENYYTEPDTVFRKIKLPRKSKKVLNIFSPDEIDLIFDSINLSPDWLRFRNYCIIALMLDSGLRQQEVCDLTKESINFERCDIKVKGKGDKERFVPLGIVTKNYIQQYLSNCPFDKEYLFCTKTGDKISTNTVKLFVTKLRKKTGLDLSSHKLRHNFATNYCLDMYERNGQIDIYKLMVILGHEDIETTRIYLHIASQLIATKGHISHLDLLKNA